MTMYLAALLCLSLLVIAAPLAASAAAPPTIVVASFTNGNCTEVRTNPQTLTSGQCIWSGDFKFYYSITQDETDSNTANYLLGCAEGCNKANCTASGSTQFGTCPLIALSNASSVYVSAWRVVTDKKVALRVFTDDQCANQLQGTGTTDLDSNTCTAVKSLQQTLMVSVVDERDAPESKRLAYRVSCNADCSSCQYYGRAAPDTCTKAAGVWVIASTDLSPQCPDNDDGKVSLAVWALVLIIVGSAAGGGLFCFILAFILFRLVFKHRDNYTRINA